MLNVDKNVDGEKVIFTLDGSFDKLSTEKFEQLVISAVSPFMKKKKMNVIFDCSQLKYLGIAGIKSFLKMRKFISMLNGSLTIKSANDNIKNIFEKTDLYSGFVFSE